MKVAIVELTNSHAECIYTKVLAYQDAGNELLFIGTEEVWRRLSFQALFSDHFFLAEKDNLKQYLKAKRFMKDHQVGEIYLNTASGKAVRNFLVISKSKSQKVSGLIHNIKKLKKSSTQRIISTTVKQYFVLAEYLKEAAVGFGAKQKLQVLVNNKFPEFHSKPIDKPNDEYWVCIPGQVEFKRRDYELLFLQINKEKLSPNIKLILLGKSKHLHGNGTEIEAMVQNLGISDQVKMWDKFVTNKEFEQYMKASDILLPLIHEQHNTFNQYQYQISGTFNLALAYQKPILMSNNIWEISEIEHLRKQYPEDKLIQKLNTLASQK